MEELCQFNRRQWWEWFTVPLARLLLRQLANRWSNSYWSNGRHTNTRYFLTADSNITHDEWSGTITIAAAGSGVTPSGLTGNDTNVTMTLGGTPATALLQTVSMTLGWTGQLSLTRGGTNANLTAVNGGMVYSTASRVCYYASFNRWSNSYWSNGSTPTPATLTAGSNITITNGPGTITIAAAGSGVTPSALTEINDTNVTMTLGGTPATALYPPFQ